MQKLKSLFGVREFLFLSGLASLTGGTWVEYGMAYGLMSAGAVLLFVAVKGL